jgi:uncharacterized alkaline shock family protein YloU
VEVSTVPDDRPSEGADSGERLPCGASVDDLFAQVTDGRLPRDAAHQQTCPHCRAALAEFREVWAPVHDLAAEQVRAPARLLDAVMARVRELSRHPWYAVVPGPTGHTRIAARVVGVVARLAAESVPHVSLALGRGRDAAALDRNEIAGPAGEAATEVGVVGTHAVVDVQIAVDHGAPIPEVARQVREQISRDLQRYTGLTTTEVNVRVVDVHPRPSSDAGE